MKQHIQGLSLVELSIVLVVIGLLVGGVMAGQSLLRASEIRSLITDINNYRSAVNQFKTEYRYWPGDMPTATRFWAASSNGNGNGIVEFSGAAGAFSEAFTFWQQLALAGFIQGTYNGMAASNSFAGFTAKVNAPAARIPSVAWGATYIDNSSGSISIVFKQNYQNWLSVGSLSVDNVYADSPFLKVDEAYAIDQKIDDGLPAQGGVQMAYEPSGNIGNAAQQCSTAASVTDYNATYNLGNSSASNACALLIRY